MEQEEHSHNSNHAKSAEERWKNVKAGVKKINYNYVIFALVGVLVSVLALGLVAISILHAAASHIYFTVLLGRVIGAASLNVTGLVILFTSAIVTIRVLRKSNNLNLLSTLVTLVVVASVQVLILTVAVKVTQNDEMKILKELVRGFNSSQNGHIESMRSLDKLQYDHKCCGVFGPRDYQSNVEDYRPIQISASCCPEYDINDNRENQEEMRLDCKATKSYYSKGCLNNVTSTLKSAARATMSVTCVLVCVEFIEAVLVVIVYKRTKDRNNADKKIRCDRDQEGSPPQQRAGAGAEGQSAEAAVIAIS